MVIVVHFGLMLEVLFIWASTYWTLLELNFVPPKQNQYQHVTDLQGVVDTTMIRTITFDVLVKNQHKRMVWTLMPTLNCRSTHSIRVVCAKSWSQCVESAFESSLNGRKYDRWLDVGCASKIFANSMWERYYVRWGTNSFLVWGFFVRVSSN